jgi:nitrite reductase/ring-hydroxylating ferredoxin subunit
MIPLCTREDLPLHGARGFDPYGDGQDTVFVVRAGAALHAYEDRCPHHGTPMAWRKDAYLDARGDHIVCSAHGATFEIGTGLCTLGPCLGQSLRAVPLSIGADGRIGIKDGR